MTDAYTEKAQAARALLYAENPAGRELVKVACEQARALAPDAKHRRQWDRILAAFDEGHRFKVATFPAVVSTTDPLDPELVAAIEEVFES